MNTVKLSLENSSYNAYIGAGAINELPTFLRSSARSKKLVLITNPTVLKLHGERLQSQLTKHCFEVEVLTIPDGEEHKSLKSAETLYTELCDREIDRHTTVIALGGGVIGDIAGFVAATYMRGVALVHIPTTLLAQADSSIGGKTGVNLAKYKNQVGVFYQPQAVFSDSAVLQTLPTEHIANGLAEIIKSSVIGDSQLFALLRQNIDDIQSRNEKVLEEVIVRAVTVKASVVRGDEKDHGIRNTLNFGHTVGHALESISSYKLNHGSGVAIGMIIASRIAHNMGLFSAAELASLIDLIDRAGLPTSLPKTDTTAIVEAVRHDKKASLGFPLFILPERIGKVIISDKVTPEMLIESIEK
ncbi:MAG: 3-dehydroquinate synthase [Dehalococcoidia bacterium]|nr:3-dehydroquinate synthase [Dehalococcoidia bacterium]